MRRILTLTAGSVLLATALSAAPCAPSDTTLCLNDSRFEVEVSWRDSRDRTGVGQAVPITADTGYFWFFSETNIELVIKVLDARSINEKFWVFFGALSNVEYDITVTDTVTGAVKTYHNPLGQFASVGDTGAFDPSVTAPIHETVATEGTQTPPDSLEAIQAFIDAPLSKSAEAFTPCPDTGAFLYLANCRFRLDVHWTDARGRHGAGRPVQLTNDTGYFWFFSETNVELMVKVLDARGISDKFWVFFGALTNVEYTLHVTDTVSGHLRAYQNPPSTFASVGDTAAFRGGYGVDIDLDSARTVTGTISAEAGGSLSVSAGDGALFTLEVPPNAIFYDQEITMTPVRVAGAFPFAGGLAAGVDLQPAGLVLLEGATLSIHTSSSIPRSEETPVAWNGSGEDFFLFPPADSSGDIQLFIDHFGGYGVARGNDAERALQLGREPVADGDLLSHTISPLLREGRAEAAGAMSPASLSTDDWRSRLRAELDADYVELREDMRDGDGDPTIVLLRLLRATLWRILVRRLGSLDTVFPGRRAELRGLEEQMLRRSLNWIHDRCSQDPLQIQSLPVILDVIHRDGYPLSAEVNETVRCLTFKLRFQSTVNATQHLVEGPLNIKQRVLAEITLRTERWPSATAGEGTINSPEFSITNVPPRCSVLSQSTSPSTFKARIIWKNLHRSADSNPSFGGLRYNPGTPSSEVVVKCPSPPNLPLPPLSIKDSWYFTFNFLHDFTGDRDYPFKQGEWSTASGGNPWATAYFEGGIPPPSDATEETKFDLTHTPE